MLRFCLEGFVGTLVSAVFTLWGTGFKTQPKIHQQSTVLFGVAEELLNTNFTVHIKKKRKTISLRDELALKTNSKQKCGLTV